jgi:catechol 2,3-dioxygenase-like lactoylglutathione lyase family enzyme
LSANLYFHVGILVEDLEVAMTRFSAVLGFTFNDPITAEFGCLADPEPHEAFVRCTYSREGPPYIELLEANGDGLFSMAHGEGVHHLGFWEPDLEARCATLASLEVGPQGRVVSPEGATFAYFNRPADLHGTRFEFLADSSRADTEHWIRTGEFVGPTDL